MPARSRVYTVVHDPGIYRGEYLLKRARPLLDRRFAECRAAVGIQGVDPAVRQGFDEVACVLRYLCRPRNPFGSVWLELARDSFQMV
jgi:hypothetical protein